MSEPEPMYQSPFSWRYGSAVMRQLWSEAEKRRRWRRVWVALAEAEQAAGLVTALQVADLRAHMNDIDLARADEIEAEIKHDMMAEVRTYAEQCKIGGESSTWAQPAWTSPTTRRRCASARRLT